MTPQELKNSILQLAIQGKLVEQRPEEGTAEELYKKIQAEKQKLIKAGKIKKEKPLPEITEDEVPFEIPESWKWVRISDLAILENGDRSNRYPVEHDYVNFGIPFLGAKDLDGQNVSFESVRYITQGKFDELGNGKLQDKDFICLLRGSVGKTAIFRIDDRHRTGFICAQMLIIRCINESLCDYLQLFLNTPQYFSMVESKTTGTAVRQLPARELAKITVPLPPLAEQKRIVAKIEELLPLADRYGEAWDRLEELNKRFPNDMRKSVLQLAIQGKLVEQRPEEGTAEELYKKIQAEKQKLIKAGKIKKEKPLPEITEDEIPFEIPESWKWVRLGDCTSYAQTKEKIASSAISPTVWSLDLEDIEKDTGNVVNHCLAKERRITGDKVIFHKGQILYCKLRPYLKKILVSQDDGVCTSELVPFNAYGHINAQFIVFFLKSPLVDFNINSVTYGVKMPRVGTETMTNLLLPLPPLAEQRRIVAKIEEILSLRNILGGYKCTLKTSL